MIAGTEHEHPEMHLPLDISHAASPSAVVGQFGRL
jgi:hypothetical protein